MEILSSGQNCPHITYRTVGTTLCSLCANNIHLNYANGDITCNRNDTRIGRFDDSEHIECSRNGSHISIQCKKDENTHVGSVKCVECEYCHGAKYVKDTMILYCSYGYVPEEKPNIFKAFN